MMSEMMIGNGNGRYVNGNDMKPKEWEGYDLTFYKVRGSHTIHSNV